MCCLIGTKRATDRAGEKEKKLMMRQIVDREKRGVCCAEKTCNRRKSKKSIRTAAEVAAGEGEHRAHRAHCSLSKLCRLDIEQRQKPAIGQIGATRTQQSQKTVCLPKMAEKWPAGCAYGFCCFICCQRNEMKSFFLSVHHHLKRLCSHPKGDKRAVKCS